MLGGALRISSIDALRGFTMFMMIFVNDLAGAGKIAPDWMVHYSDRHKGPGVSGMTFVDLVFPGFLFIVGMSIPIALSSRIAKGDPLWKLLLHVVVRTVSLLAIGILMVNGESHPSAKEMGFSANTWYVVMFSSALLAFCTISPPNRSAGDMAKRLCRALTILLRTAGMAGMAWAAWTFRNKNGGRIISLDPFYIHTSWYGILGLIGWAYLVAAIVFLVFRTNRTAILGCIALLLCLFAADRKGLFENFFLSHIVGIGEDLGSLASISTAGVLLGTLLLEPNDGKLDFKGSFWSTYIGIYVVRNPLLSRIAYGLWGTKWTRFTLLFIAGCAAAAFLLTPQWGISKNNATPAWCLWSCAITAAIWLLFYFLADVWQLKFISKPLAVAGQNVLLAYILSEMMESVFNLIHWHDWQLSDWYGGLIDHSLTDAILRSAGCGVFILCLTALLNRLGFRLKL